MLTETDGLTTRDITLLPLDHPGAKDLAYRARRDELAALALEAARLGGEPLPLRYTAEEDATWRVVTGRLAPLHQALACSAYLAGRELLPVSTQALPDLRSLSRALQSLEGFRLAAIPGLVDSRSFLGAMAEGVMPCTQYIRHASRPEYTPEPDVVHEVIGHVPLLADPDLVAVSQAIGRAARSCSDAELPRLERLYWFTLEFGLVEERAGLRAYGAGLLSSFGELPHAFTDAVQRQPFDVATVVETPFDFSRMQDVVFVVPSFAFLREQVESFLG